MNRDCPVVGKEGERLQMAHGGGGQMTQDLLAELLPLLPGAPPVAERHDGVVLAAMGADIAFTTDSYVVRPLTFAGGDIGSLAVIGTCNDLSMCGATPQWLSCALIIEEGLSRATLQQVMRSMAVAARDSAVAIVTGDTKVVERGKGDGLYINTAGIGVLPPGRRPGPWNLQPGDVVILSGDLGRHSMAVMAARGELQFAETMTSDLAPLAPAVAALYAAGVSVHGLRDLTRGGLAANLAELGASAGLAMVVEEEAIPVLPAVQAAAAILGLDPLHMANEGRFVAMVPKSDAERAVAALKGVPVAAGARVVGEVVAGPAGRLSLKGLYGTSRVVPRLSGLDLPRIC